MMKYNCHPWSSCKAILSCTLFEAVKHQGLLFLGCALICEGGFAAVGIALYAGVLRMLEAHLHGRTCHVNSFLNRFKTHSNHCNTGVCNSIDDAPTACKWFKCTHSVELVGMHTQTQCCEAVVPNCFVLHHCVVEFVTIVIGNSGYLITSKHDAWLYTCGAVCVAL